VFSRESSASEYRPCNRSRRAVIAIRIASTIHGNNPHKPNGTSQTAQAKRQKPNGKNQTAKTKRQKPNGKNQTAQPQAILRLRRLL
jgi:hypothetical protein